MEPLESRRLLSSYLVSPTGNDSAAGTADAPWLTLQHAANMVQAGDSVTVLPGNYVGFQLTASGTADHPISFAAQTGAVISSRNPSTPDGINLEGASYVSIAGFTLDGLPRVGIRSVQNQGVKIFNNQIDHSGYWGILTGFSEGVDIENNSVGDSVKQHGIYIGNSADNPVVRGNTVFNNNQSGIQINSDASQGGDGIITGALIENNIVYGNGIAGGAAINLDGVQQSLIQNNLLFDNHGTGIAIYKQDGAASPKDDIFVNNTVTMAEDARWAVSVSNGATGIYFGNDIFLTDSERRGSICVSPDSIAGITGDFNVVTNRFSSDGGDSNLSLREWQQQTNQDGHSLLSTPDRLFADYAHHDFHIAQYSEAQNGGSPLHAPKKDLESKPPADAAHPAIGAYQNAKTQAAGAMSLWHRRAAGSSIWKWSILAGLAGAAAIVGVVRTARKRNIGRWLLPCIIRSLRPRLRAGRDIHLLLCIADHYEPQNGDVNHDTAMQRVNRWTEQYPARLGKFRDSDGKPPQHTFFYPLEQYNEEEMTAIAGLCHAGFGEVEVHLHHDHDTPDNLRSRLTRYTRVLADHYRLLSTRQSDGKLMYGFVHGNWALDNSRPDGRWCGVDNELEILQQTGCYADFTLPSAPSSTQVRKLNSIYYATEDGKPRSHETGVDVGRRKRPNNALMMIQGPLVLNWHSLKWGILPRIENACLQANQPPDANRLDLWLKAAVQVPKRPDWYFVKLHTHGAPEANAKILLGDEMLHFHAQLDKRSIFDSRFHYHYVTARQMYNLARAAEAGWKGSVDEARDFELKFNGADHSWNEQPENAGLRATSSEKIGSR